MRLIAITVLSFVLAIGGARAEGMIECYKAQGAQEGGDHALAIDYYTRCITWGGQTRESLAGTYNNRGVAYADKGEYDRAIQDYDEALRLDPSQAVAYNNRGNAYIDKGDFDRAIADYQ